MEFSLHEKRFLMHLILFIFMIINLGCSDDNHKHNNISKDNNNINIDLCKLEIMNDNAIFDIMGIKRKRGIIGTIYDVVLLLEDDKNCTSLRNIITSNYFKDIVPDELRKALDKTDIELIVAYRKYKKDIEKYLKKWLEETTKKEYVLLYPIDLAYNYDKQKEVFYEDLGYDDLYAIGEDPFCSEKYDELGKKYNKWIDFSKVVLPIIYLENLKRSDDAYFYTDRIPLEIAIKVKKRLGDNEKVWSFMALAIKFKNFKKAAFCYGLLRRIEPIYVGRIFKVGIINIRKTSDSKFICEVIWEKDY